MIAEPFPLFVWECLLSTRKMRSTTGLCASAGLRVGFPARGELEVRGARGPRLAFFAARVSPAWSRGWLCPRAATRGESIGGVTVAACSNNRRSSLPPRAFTGARSGTSASA